MVVKTAGAYGWQSVFDSASNRNDYQDHFMVVKTAGAYGWQSVFDSASNRNDYQDYFMGVKAAGAYDKQLYHSKCRLSWNLGSSTSWNSQDLSRPVTGLLTRYSNTPTLTKRLLVHMTRYCKDIVLILLFINIFKPWVKETNMKEDGLSHCNVFRQ